VGYGDLAPASDVGRLLAALEALLGQVFLVTFVALLVGLLAERWRVNRSPAGPGE
jgi:Ion channel